MAYIDNFAIDYDQAYSMLRGLDGGYSNSIRNIRWELYRRTNRIDSKYATIPNGVTATTAVKWTGLTASTTYKVWATISNINGGTYPDVILSESFTTDPLPMPKIATPSLNVSYTQKTNNTLSVKCYSETGASWYRFELWNYAKSSRLDYTTSTDTYAYFGGLSAGTSYQIRLYAYGNGYEDSDWSSWYIATTTAVTGWNWWHSTLPNNVINLQRLEWIAFQNKINEIRVAKGYSSYPFSTSGVYVGSPIKAWHFNDAINAINAMRSSNYISQVSVGEKISSAKMIEMKDKLNSSI